MTADVEQLKVIAADCYINHQESQSRILLQAVEELEQLRAEIEQLCSALREIERFGHNEGHGRGFTCANIADKALGEISTKEVEPDLSPADWDDLTAATNELRAVKYTQSDIDSAVAAERERCAALCERCAAAIRAGESD